MAISPAAVVLNPAKPLRWSPRTLFKSLTTRPPRPASLPPNLHPFRAHPFPSRRRTFCSVISGALRSGEATTKPELGNTTRVGEFRKKLKVVDIKGGPEEGLDRVGQTLVVMGWVRTLRVQSSITFIEINDGSCLSNMQCVMDSEAEGYDQVESGLVSTGASIWVQGTLVGSRGSKQKVELKLNKIVVVGKSDPSYPIQKKRVSREFLRTKAHLRPRTNTFGAVARVRNALAYATHKFFQENGFVWLSSPIITASDCEGAGEQFCVTTLIPNSVEPANSLVDGIPKTKDGSIDWSQDFFGKPAFLTVSGQLNGETYATALSDVYTFGPTFRAENSNTARHLAEFWMIEPELAFADLNDDMACATAFLQYVPSLWSKNICSFGVCSITQLQNEEYVLLSAFISNSSFLCFFFVFCHPNALQRMEKVVLSSFSARAKIIGSIVSVSGALVLTLYKGPIVLSISSGTQFISLQQASGSSQSTWLIGSLLITTEYLLCAIWYIVQTQVMKVYPAEFVVVFFYYLCGTLLLAPVCFMAENDLNAWRLGPDGTLAAVLYSGLFGYSLTTFVHTWALRLKGPVYVATFKPLSIAIAAIMGFIFLGDALYLGSIIGAVIISIGFYTVLWGKAKEQETIEEFDFSGLASSSDDKLPLLRSH